MKAIRIHEFGGPEVLKYEDAPELQPSPGEIRIKVIAAGVNPMDWIWKADPDSGITLTGSSPARSMV